MSVEGHMHKSRFGLLLVLASTLAPWVANAQGAGNDCQSKCSDQISACTQACKPPDKNSKGQDHKRFAACSQGCVSRAQSCFQHCK